MFREFENVLKNTPRDSLFIVNLLGPKRRENYTKRILFH